MTTSTRVRANFATQSKGGWSTFPWMGVHVPRQQEYRNIVPQWPPCKLLTIPLLENPSDEPDSIIPCPEMVALLGSTSEYFDAICFGGFASSSASLTDEIEVQEENAKAIELFVAWIYSGQIIPSKFPLFELWLLGDRLRSPQFANETMCLPFDQTRDERIWAPDYQQMFDKTTSRSKLRQYFKDVILTEGSLNEKNYERNEDWDQCFELVTKGGDLVWSKSQKEDRSSLS